MPFEELVSRVEARVAERAARREGQGAEAGAQGQGPAQPRPVVPHDPVGAAGAPPAAPQAAGPPAVVWRMGEARLGEALALMDEIDQGAGRWGIPELRVYAELRRAAVAEGAISGLVVGALVEWGQREVAAYAASVGGPPYADWVAKCHRARNEMLREVDTAVPFEAAAVGECHLPGMTWGVVGPVDGTVWYLSWAVAKGLAMSPARGAAEAGGRLRADLATAYVAASTAWMRGQWKVGGKEGRVVEVGGDGGGGVWGGGAWGGAEGGGQQRRAVACAACGVRPVGGPSGLCGPCHWHGGVCASGCGRTAAMGRDCRSCSKARSGSGSGRGGASSQGRTPPWVQWPTPPTQWPAPPPPASQPPGKRRAPHGPQPQASYYPAPPSGGRAGRGPVWGGRGRHYLPLCADDRCGGCGRWRDRQADSLDEAVRVAEAMRAAGWRPHQGEAEWDRVEQGAEEARPLGAPLSAQVRDAQRAVCGPPLAPSFLTEEEAAAGGVEVGVEAPVVMRGTVATWSTEADRDALYATLCADVAAGVLERGEVRAKGRVFVGPKGRVIYDPAAVNDAIPAEARTVRYGSVADAFAFALPLAAKLDLKDAFHSVPVANRDRPYLGLEVDGVVLRYAALPFGLATAPKRFVDCLARTLGSVGGARMVAYMDDVLVLGASAGEVVASLCAVVEALVRDGWRVSAAKTFARPTSGPIFLGFRLSLRDRAIALAPAKLPSCVAKARLVAEGAQTWRRQLHELLGFVSWAAPALKGSGFVVPALHRAWRTGAWDGEAGQCMEVLVRMLEAAVRPTPIDAPPLQVAVVTDASDAGWAVVVVDGEGQVRFVERGELSGAQQGWSSTAREAVAAVRAVSVVLAKGVGPPGSLHVHLSTDSSALAAVFARQRTRSVEVARALETLVGWVAQGLVISASWRRRSEGLQPLADAASAGHTWWHPGPELREWLRLFEVDVHVGAGTSGLSVAPRYTSVVDDEVREAVLSAAHAAGVVTWTGWIGVGSRFRCAGLAVLCHPRWGDERRSLLNLQEAARVILVTRGGSLDPAVFRGLGGSVSIHLPPEGVRWWVGERVDAEGRRLAPGLRRVQDLVVVDYVRGPQADAEQQLRLAMAQSLHPGPNLRRIVAEVRARREAEGARRAEGGRVLAAPGAPAAPSRLAALVRATREARDRQPGAARRGNGGPGRVRVPAAGGAGREAEAVATVGELEGPPTVTAVLRAVTTGSVVLGGDLNEEGERRVAEARAAVRRQGAPSTLRAQRTAAALLVTAREVGAEAKPASAVILDKLAMAYAHGRTTGPGAVLPVTASEDLSALAAMLRRLGFPAAPYLGPSTKAYLVERGAAQRRHHSNALPLPMSWLIGVEPQEGTLDHELWASRMLQAAFCLRPGIAGQVRKGNLVSWGPGWILTWVQQDKSRRQDVLAPPGTAMREWRVTATAQPQAVEAIQQYWDRAEGHADRVFPRASPTAVLAWLRRAWTHDPTQVPRLTAHGFRVGADMELHELRVPPDYINVLGWWARKEAPGRSMRAYYNSVNLGRLMCCTRLLGGMQWAAPVEGVHVGQGVEPPDWEEEWREFKARLPAQPPDLRGPATGTLDGDDDSGPD